MIRSDASPRRLAPGTCCVLPCLQREPFAPPTVRSEVMEGRCQIWRLPSYVLVVDEYLLGIQLSKQPNDHPPLDRGATKGEIQRTLPGDELVPNPKFVWNRAITIHAPATEVWPWLV
jgi:hypothetical protein